MTFGKLLVIAALTGGAAHLWQVHERSAIARDVSASADGNGFVPVAMSDDATGGTALILAAQHCPSAQARRADALAATLSQMGIPNRRTNSYTISHITREQMPMLKRTNEVLNGEIPIVIINGMAKANPTADEVAAEYRSGG